MSLTEQLLSPTQYIFNFVKDYYDKSVYNDVRNIIDWHWVYGTIDAVEKDGEIVAATRWNISPDGKTCEVLDLFISPEENGFRIMKHIIARNWHRFPNVKYIEFERQRKYPDRKKVKYDISRILKIKGD